MHNPCDDGEENVAVGRSPDQGELAFFPNISFFLPAVSAGSAVVSPGDRLNSIQHKGVTSTLTPPPTP